MRNNRRQARLSAPQGGDARELLDDLAHFVWITDPAGRTVYANRRATEVGGVGLYVGNHPGWVSLVEPVHAAEAQRIWAEALATGCDFRTEQPMRQGHGRGRYGWHVLHGRARLDARGEVDQWIVTATDIDDVERARDALRADRLSAAAVSALETLHSQAPVGFGTVDAEFRYVRLNETLATINGTSAADATGRLVAEVVPDLWPQLEPLYRRVLDHGEAILDLEVETPAPSNPDEMRRWLTSYYPVSLDDEIVGVGIVVVDVTERVLVERALETSRRSLADAQHIANLGSFRLDVTTGDVDWSAEHDRVLGDLAPREATIDAFVSMIHRHDLPRVRSAWRAVIDHGAPVDIEFRVNGRDEQVRYLRARALPERDADGRIIGALGTLMDDTERVLSERVRSAAETRFEIGFEQSTIGAVIADLEGLPTRVNRAACEILGRPPEDLLGRRWDEYSPPDEMPLCEATLARVASGHDTYEDERRYVRPDGSVVWTEAHVTLVRDEEGLPQYFYMHLQETTRRKNLEAELEHQALHDSLTGLPNRALLNDRLTQGLASSRRRDLRLGVMFLDIDEFKVINDSAGHDAGDALLCQVAARIEGAVRPGDTVARFGGDEFVVVCDGVTVEEIERIAGSVLGALGEPLVIGNHDVHVSASIGIAIADEASSPESLLRDSDAAMYRAKERGKGRVELFDEALRFEAERRFSTASQLHWALERGEFVNLYQPVVDLRTGSIVGAEALLRWAHPVRGRLEPVQFVDLAEENGLIVPIGAWVLEEACNQVLEWRRARREAPMTMAVNLSVRQLLSPDVVAVVGDVFERTGVRPADVTFELTESVFMEDAEYFGRTLADLKSLGVRLAIDDFGVGYSSLSYLKRFPVDLVKIDRGFVDGLGTENHDTALVAAIIAMAGAFGLDVIAEGVETAAQMRALAELGVTTAQGYHFAAPMPAAELTDLIRSGHRWPVADPAA